MFNRTKEHLQIFLYVPNLMDYLRLFLSICSLRYCYNERKYMCIMFFLPATLLDALDGFVARKLNQTSHAGGTLDMVTDRVSMSFVYLMLSKLYPQYESVLMMFFVIDYASHYLIFVTSGLLKKKSHKEVDESTHFLVRLYYTYFVFFAIVAAGNDAAICLSYIYGIYPCLHQYTILRISMQTLSIIVVVK